MRHFKELFLVLFMIIWCATIFCINKIQDSVAIKKQIGSERHIKELLIQSAKLRRAIEFVKTAERNYGKVSAGDDMFHREDVNINETVLAPLAKPLTKDRRSEKADLETSDKYEIIIRRIEDGIREFWYAVETEITQMERTNRNASSTSLRLALQQGSILVDIQELKDLTKNWRAKEAESLQGLVQQRIHYIQNPENCSKARQLVCTMDLACGFGCHVHHLVYCLMVAYGMKRTLIVESRDWMYDTGSWDTFFKPPSRTCAEASGTGPYWGDDEASSQEQIISLYPVEWLGDHPPYLPLGIPEDLASRLVRLHGNPSVWWVGQFTKFIMKPQDWLRAEFELAQKRFKFKRPIVGVHVRRTDKLVQEAAFHEIDEYMKHVDKWFDVMDMRRSKMKNQTRLKRRVYLATDDPTVLSEARRKYPQYKIISDSLITLSAHVRTRNTAKGLRGVIIDIHFLSKCDYLVCTFSSQVCRVAYELMQTLHPDASSYFHSLDDVYYYGGQTAHDQVAIYEHVASRPEEIDLKVGDVVGIAGNHWDGYSKGTNHRTGRVGLYPSYKVIESYRLVKYPTYPEANLKV